MKYHLISGHRCGSNFVAEILNYNNLGAHYKDPFLDTIPWWCEDVAAYEDILDRYNANAVTLKFHPYSFFSWSQLLADMIVDKLSDFEVVMLERDLWDRFVSLCYKNNITTISEDDIHNFDRRYYIERTYFDYFRSKLNTHDLSFAEINYMDEVLPNIKMFDVKKLSSQKTNNDYRLLIKNYDDAKTKFKELISVD